MRALITGTPVQIEGEPPEIAQLVELMSSGAVMVEHVHRRRLGDADDQGVQQGICWCGTTKAFAPWGETSEKRAFRINEGTTPAQQAVKARTCKRCGVAGHDVRKCPQPAAAV